MKNVTVPAPRRLPSGSWFIQIRIGGKSASFTAETEQECVKRALAYKLGLAEKEEAKKTPTLTTAIDTYIEARSNTLSPSTIRGYRTIQKTRFQPYMGRRLSGMTQADWQRACNQEAKLCSAKTLMNSWRFLASVIHEETGKRYEIRLPQVVPNERPFLDPDQIDIFTAAIRGTKVEIPALLALSSLRKSEILALRWEDVDLEKGLLHVNGAAVRGEGKELVYKKANKNSTSNRKVPIMMDQLRTALAEAPKEGEYVVQIYQNGIRNWVNRICRANGLPEVGVHGLRHSFASLAYHLGVPEKVAMEIGGWSDYQTMRKIYTHVAKSDIEHYGKEMSDFFNK